MSRELNYTLCRDRYNQPLVTLDSPLGNGQEITPDSLRRLAHELREIADRADASNVGKGYVQRKHTTEY